MGQLNSIVDFEMAKLLKEKGFDEYCLFIWNEENLVNPYYYAENYGMIDLRIHYYENIPMINNPYIEKYATYVEKDEITEEVYELLTAPTIAETIDWIYNKHGIWILVDWMTRIKPYNSGFYSHLRGTNKPLNQDNFISINNTKSPGYEVFNSPKEAYIEAIKYVLTKMI